MSTPMDDIRFEQSDIGLFAAASLDFNPLHISAEYARRSFTGEQVVYGCLVFLACLARMRPPEGTVISGVELKFRVPHLLGVPYSFAWKQQGPDKLVGTLRDGGTTTLMFRLTLHAGNPGLARWPDRAGKSPQREARYLSDDSLKSELTFEGEYLPPFEPYAQLLSHLSLERMVWGDTVPLLALCSSYLTGMELPGERAMFTELSATLDPNGMQTALCEFTIASQGFDPRYAAVTTAFQLRNEGVQSCEGTTMAVLRPGSIPMSAAGGVVSERLKGQIAIVLGASRGLGAALAMDLVRAGATVIGVFSRSDKEAAILTKTAETLPGRLLMLKGNVADQAWCESLRQRIEAEFGRIDLMILNAAAPPVRLRLEPSSLDRINSYVLTGFNMVACPLSVFLELLARNRGTLILISSNTVMSAPKILPHYVAMKSALEGLLASAAHEHCDVVYWIARPGRMQTEMTAPSDWAEAEPPAEVSARILKKTVEEAPRGEIHYC